MKQGKKLEANGLNLPWKKISENPKKIRDTKRKIARILLFKKKRDC